MFWLFVLTLTFFDKELSSMEEKMEYQLEERTRDMQELLETCQTRVSASKIVFIVMVSPASLQCFAHNAMLSSPRNQPLYKCGMFFSDNKDGTAAATAAVDLNGGNREL